MVSGQVEDATQESNVPLGIQEGTSSQPQSTAVKDSPQLTFGRTRKNLNYCALCKKGFSSKSALVMHRRAHMAAKPFKCVRCKKRFFCKSGLMIHRKKPFSCKPFKKGALVLHTLVHTGKNLFFFFFKIFLFKFLTIIRIAEFL